MSRDASTYRGARRNRCIRKEKMVWGPAWYYSAHDNAHAYPRGFVGDTRAARYLPAEKQERKPATTTGGTHEFIRRGDYAGAVKAFFGNRGAAGRVKASGRGD
jgi:hypothetical protein